MVSKRYYSTSSDTTLIQEWLKILIQNNNSNSAEINSNLEKIISSLNSISINNSEIKRDLDQILFLMQFNKEEVKK